MNEISLIVNYYHILHGVSYDFRQPFIMLKETGLLKQFLSKKSKCLRSTLYIIILEFLKSKKMGG